MIVHVDDVIDDDAAQTVTAGGVDGVDRHNPLTL